MPIAITVATLAVVAIVVFVVPHFAPSQRGQLDGIVVDVLPRSDDAWPGPVRAEPLGGAGNVELVELPGEERLAIEDATGEVGQGVPEWIDISTIDIQRTATMESGRGVALNFDLVAGRPMPDPPGRLVAYGVVIDSNNDGVPDYRIGMDNTPGPARREWISNLATGEATINDSGSYGMGAFGLFTDTYFPGEADRDGEGHLLAADATPGLRFYVWASVIHNGGAAVTDYAPDRGWISFQPDVPGEADHPVVPAVQLSLAAYLLQSGFEPVDDSWPAPRVTRDEALSIASEGYRGEVQGDPPAPIALVRRVSADIDPPETRWLVVFEFPAGFECVAADLRTRAECPVGMVFVVDDQSGELLGRLVEWQ